VRPPRGPEAGTGHFFHGNNQEKILTYGFIFVMKPLFLLIFRSYCVAFGAHSIKSCE
jgi:hypothetical protein